MYLRMCVISLMRHVAMASTVFLYGSQVAGEDATSQEVTKSGVSICKYIERRVMLPIFGGIKNGADRLSERESLPFDDQPVNANHGEFADIAVIMHFSPSSSDDSKPGWH